MANPRDVVLAIIRLSDCLLAGHPDTPRQGTVPEMMDAAVEEIERLRSALDEANAHLAWAREDGKNLRRALEIMAVQAVWCDGCAYYMCGETPVERDQCRADCVEEAIRLARKGKS